MSIIDLMKDHKSKKTYEEINADALRMFDQQKNAIKSIKNEEGYKEIKKYWGRVKEAAITRMISSTVSDERAKAQYALADEFVKFLESREF
jgi:hypothetical protein